MKLPAFLVYFSDSPIAAHHGSSFWPKDSILRKQTACPCSSASAELNQARRADGSLLQKAINDIHTSEKLCSLLVKRGHREERMRNKTKTPEKKKIKVRKTDQKSPGEETRENGQMKGV